MKHEISWIAVSLALGPRSAWLKPLLRQYKTPEEILVAEKRKLLEQFPEMGMGVLSALVSRETLQTAERIAGWCHQNGVCVLCPDNEAYPAGLLEIAEPPAVLYCMGKLPLPRRVPTVGIVGRRRIDAYGERVTYKLSFELAAAGVAVISGMAQGVDAVAACAALDAEGHTVAVLGSGIDVIYPRQHEQLFREIATFGTVVTEFPPGTRPNGWNFPIRNRLISALSDALVVTEADDQSGSLITARYALLQGKTLFAVPGDIDSLRSTGTNGLIRSGALPALGAEDVMARFRFLYPELGSVGVPAEAIQYSEVTGEKLRARGVAAVAGDDRVKAPQKSKKINTVSGDSSAFHQKENQSQPTAPSSVALEMLDPRQRQLYDLLPEGAFSLDHLTAQGISPSEAAATLTVLELYGILTSCPGGTYRKQ